MIGDLLKGRKIVNPELANKQFSVLLNAGIEQDDIYVRKDDIDNLSKEDVDILIEAFKKSTIIN